MGLFKEAAARFKRTSWRSVQTLADEMFSVFGSALDLTPQSITINQAPGATIPPLVINQPAGPNNPPPIQINNGGTVTNIGGGGTGNTGGGGGGPDLGNIVFPGQQPGDVNVAVPPPNQNPIVLHGRVSGKVGGTVYKVRCWAKNPVLYPPIGILDVEFPDVDPTDIIPNGVRCPVIMFPKLVSNVVQPDKSIGYVPVWLVEE